MRRFVLVVGAACLLSACPKPKPAVVPPLTTTGRAGGEFVPGEYRSVIDAVLQAYFKADPPTATRTGEHAWDGEWPAIGADDQVALVADFRARAQALRDIERLAPETCDPAACGTDRPRLDARLLADRLEGRAEHVTLVRPFERDPSMVLGVVGVGIHGIVAHPYAPKHTRYYALLSRVEKIPKLLETARPRLVDPLRAGLENMAVVSQGLAAMLRGEIFKVDAKDVENDKELPPRLRAAADAAAKAIEAYTADVAKAFPLDKAKNTPIGAPAWQKLARLNEGVTDSPEDVKALGEREILRLTRELDVLVEKTGQPYETRQSFIGRLQADVPVADKVLDEYRKTNEGVETWIKGARFVTVPWERKKIEIVQSPPHLRGVSFASLNVAGPLDAIEEAQFEVNTPDARMPKERQDALLAFHARSMMENISVHEAIPGHYLQGLYSRQAPSKVRRVLWNATYGEGWAHYCEEAVLEAGYKGKDATAARGAMLRMALQRAVRVVVDVGENDGSMTEEQAQKRLETDAMLPPHAAKIEARRAIVWPVNMFAYTYGKLQIVALREAVRKRDRDAFDLVRFHDAFLGVGPAPVREIGLVAFKLDVDARGP